MTDPDTEAQRILAMSDAELREHLEAEGLDVDAEAARVRSIIRDAIEHHAAKEVVNLGAAAACCRTLIAAYEKDSEHVDWSDVQDALGFALRAMGLPEDHIDQHRQRQEDEDEGTDTPPEISEDDIDHAY